MWRWRMLLVVLILLLVLGQPILSRAVKHDRLVLGRDYTLGRNLRLDGDLTVFGGDVILEPGSQVSGDVLAFGGSIRIAGRVERQAVALSGDVRLDATGAVAGDILASGPVEAAPGARAGGQVISGYWAPVLWFGWPWGFGFGNILVWSVQAILGSLVAVALGILVVLVAPGPVRTAGQALVAHPWQSLGVSLLTGLVAVVGVPLLAVTVVGIPVAVVGLACLAAAVLLGAIVAARALGQRLLVAFNRPSQALLPPTVVGLLTLSLLTAVPCLGTSLLALAGGWGLGAVVLTRFGTVPFRASPPRVAPPREPPGWRRPRS